MLRPFLIVGVGGSGGKTLRVIRKDLEDRLVKAGYTKGFPSGWQLLHIDVPTLADGNDPDLPAQLPVSDYQGMVGTGVDYRTIDTALVQKGGRHEVDALGGWRPNPDKVNIPAARGAGQYRALGRIITVAGLDRVRDAVKGAHRQITGAQTIAELQEVTRAFGGTPSPKLHEPTVIVVSSIAGGSGSGAVIDVCDVVRSVGGNGADDIVGILYAPDVFDYLPEEARRGVRPNSLAALTELLNGYWSEHGPSDGTSEIFASHGVQVGNVKRLGPRFPYLVGARNEHITFQTQNDVYRAMGKSLGAWVASPTLQDRMSAYVHTQWPSTAQAVQDAMPMHTHGSETPFKALGSSRIGLGRDRFFDYASQHLAKAAATRIIDQHEALRASDDDRPASALVREIAGQSFGRFIERSGLHERGDEKNQIIDALMPPTTKDRAGVVAQAILQRVEGAIPEKGARPAEVSREILAALRDQRVAFHRDQRAAQDQVASEWAKSIQSRLITEVALTIAREGAPVTVELLQRLKTEVSQVRDELANEAQLRRHWIQSVESEVGRALADKPTAVILKSTGSLRTAVSRAAESLLWEAEVDGRELAVEVIPDLVRHLLEPMIEAVEHGSQRLSNDATAGADGKPAVMASWPEGDLVPHLLRPAPNEFLIEPYEEFPATLRNLVARTVGIEQAQAARDRADIQVVLGVDDVDHVGADDQTLLVVGRPWVPRHERFHDSPTAAPTGASFSLAAEAAALLNRAGAWLTKPGTAAGNFMAEGLRDYLDPDAVSPREHTDRLERFEGQLVSALNAATPLASINPSVLTLVHNVKAAKYDLSFTGIPLPDKTPAKARFKEVLEASGLWSEAINKAFTDSADQSIDIFTVLGEPYQPVVFDSLMKPIAAEWGQRSASPDTRAEFWRWRRARPLTEALPFSADVLQNMVTGWFTASLLTQLRTDALPAAVFLPQQGGRPGEFAEFPRIPLTAPQNSAQLLPAVLESFALAMVEVNVQASLAPVAPYARLAELGSTAASASDLNGGELRGWILDGTNAMASGPDTTTTWEVRQRAALEKLAKWHAGYESHYADVERRGELLDVPLSFELRSQVRSALQDLKNALTNMAPGGDLDVFN